ncbi:hypothetical protein VTJ04DRAFT_6817 [Mycothermus thermophilus]|uniref:uncharacterized protein n=1 Tax=Humicola insolens TaxID=85995 RepID=UPI0037447F6D
MTNRPANRGVGVRSVKFAGRGGFAAGSASDPHPAGKGRRKRANRQRKAVADTTKSFNWTEDMGEQGKGGRTLNQRWSPGPETVPAATRKGEERSTSIHHGSQAPKVSCQALNVQSFGPWLVCVSSVALPCLYAMYCESHIFGPGARDHNVFPSPPPPFPPKPEKSQNPSKHLAIHAQHPDTLPLSNAIYGACRHSPKSPPETEKTTPTMRERGVERGGERGERIGSEIEKAIGRSPSTCIHPS